MALLEVQVQAITIRVHIKASVVVPARVDIIDTIGYEIFFVGGAVVLLGILLINLDDPLTLALVCGGSRVIGVG